MNVTFVCLLKICHGCNLSTQTCLSRKKKNREILLIALLKQSRKMKCTMLSSAWNQMVLVSSIF